MTTQEAVKYITKVLANWGHWRTHHEKLVEAIEVLLEAVNDEG